MEQLSELAPTRVVAGDVIAFLFRSGHTVSGVSGLCTHMPCTLNWDGSLLCPCHNVRFQNNGLTKELNYEVPPLPRVMVKVVGGRVYVFAG